MKGIRQSKGVIEKGRKKQRNERRDKVVIRKRREKDNVRGLKERRKEGLRRGERRKGLVRERRIGRKARRKSYKVIPGIFQFYKPTRCEYAVYSLITQFRYRKGKEER